MDCMHMLNIFSGEDSHKYIEKHFPKRIKFSEEDKMVAIGNLRPLYITMAVGENTLNRAFVDTEASLNLISQNTIHQLRIPPIEIKHFTTKVWDFSGERQRTIRTLNLEITIEPIKAIELFHVTEADITCHIILGQSWLQKHGIVSSTDQQCIKFLHDGKEWRVAATKNPFTRAEKDLFPEAAFYEQENTTIFEDNVGNGKKI